MVAFTRSVCLILVVQRELFSALTATTTGDTYPQLTVRIIAVQQQQNGTDCGVFALAYVTSLLHGQDPESVTYDTSKLRSHLLHCLHQGHMSPFPLTATKHDRCKTKDVAIILYCSCRMPWQKADDSDPAMQMVQCDNCLEWFHHCCENIPDNIFVTNSFWECLPKKRLRSLHL